MYQNRVTLIGFAGGDAEVRRRSSQQQQSQPNHTLAGDRVVL